ncbi:MAG: Y-family DNA polymerase [Alphaproteobacteria bacterium]|nr:MAG: Y-family DNA polymerase [Alphaproteobacteria bacterium]
MFALVDGNNFYASCQQLWEPQLRGKPLVVLSNNDGCAIARSAEAKALGIKMGHPAHELGEMVRRHGLQIRSANFTLYGDMSARVVEVLRESGLPVEVYSIDESFVDLSKIRHRLQFARELRDRIRQWTGIPNCIGIGPTKTLAKAANKLAKKRAGVVDLSDRLDRDEALRDYAVEDLWGVGRKWTAKLTGMGIATAAQLRDAPTDLILEKFGVVLTRTQRELQGQPCMGMEEVEPDRQQIMVSRSFGERVVDHEAFGQAAATFASRACEKLRHRGLTTAGVWVLANSDPFRPDLPQHNPSRTTQMPIATADTRIVLGVVRLLLQGLLKQGIPYKRAGVALLDLARPEDRQGDLFNPAVIGNDVMMATMDRINRRFGRGTLGFGATGWQEKPTWGMKQLSLSPCYTTRIQDIPVAYC